MVQLGLGVIDIGWERPFFFREGFAQFDIFLQTNTSSLNPYLGTHKNQKRGTLETELDQLDFVGLFWTHPNPYLNWHHLTPLRLKRNSGRWIQWAMMYSAYCFARWKRTVAGPTMVLVHHPCCVKCLVVALLSIHICSNFFCGVKHLLYQNPQT